MSGHVNNTHFHNSVGNGGGRENLCLCNRVGMGKSSTSGKCQDDMDGARGGSMCQAVYMAVLAEGQRDGMT